MRRTDRGPAGSDVSNSEYPSHSTRGSALHPPYTNTFQSLQGLAALGHCVFLLGPIAKIWARRLPTTAWGKREIERKKRREGEPGRVKVVLFSRGVRGIKGKKAIALGEIWPWCSCEI